LKAAVVFIIFYPPPPHVKKILSRGRRFMPIIFLYDSNQMSQLSKT
jgi:hypothetical protein